MSVKIEQKFVSVDFLRQFMRYLDRDQPLEKKQALETLLEGLDDESKAAHTAIAGISLMLEEQTPLARLTGANAYLHMGIMIGVGLAMGSASKECQHLAQTLFSKPENVSDISEAFRKRGV